MLHMLALSMMSMLGELMLIMMLIMLAMVVGGVLSSGFTFVARRHFLLSHERLAHRQRKECDKSQCKYTHQATSLCKSFEAICFAKIGV